MDDAKQLEIRRSVAQAAQRLSSAEREQIVVEAKERVRQYAQALDESAKVDPHALRAPITL